MDFDEAKVSVPLREQIQCSTHEQCQRSQLRLFTLLENGPKVKAKGTSCCCSRYPTTVPAATAAGTFGLGPTPWRTIGTGWRYKPVPMRQHRNRFVPPPGAKCRRQYRHRLVGPTGAYCVANGTGSCRDPVPADARAKGTGLCLDPVLLNNI